MIYLTGDCHGDMSRFKFTDYQFNDIVIILGDFGGIFYNESKQFNEARKEWEDDIFGTLGDQRCTFLFIDGNHDNIDRLENLPTQYKFGNQVGVASDNVYWLKRGHVYTIEDKKFLCMGGALSQDKHRRTEGVDWWRNENPTFKDWNKLELELLNNDYKVDYVLTHTPPEFIVTRILKWQAESDPNTPRWMIEEGTMFNKSNDPTSKTLSKVYDMTKFDIWFFGHMHANVTFKDYPKFVGLYEKIVPLVNIDEYHKLLPNL